MNQKIHYPEQLLIAMAVFVACLALSGPSLRSQEIDWTMLQKYKMLEPRVAKAEKLVLAKNWPKAEKEIGYCLKALPSHHQAHFFLGQVRYFQGRFDEAQVQMAAAQEGFLQLTSQIKQFQNEKAKLRQDEEIQKQELITELGKNVERGNCRTDASLTEINRLKGEIQSGDKPTQAKSSGLQLQMPAEYRYWSGNCHFRLKRYGEAEAQYRQALQLDPSHALAANNLVNLLFMQKRIDDARQVIAQAEASGAAITPELKKAVQAAEVK